MPGGVKPVMLLRLAYNLSCWEGYPDSGAC
jgi:hypothetical protein